MDKNPVLLNKTLVIGIIILLIGISIISLPRNVVENATAYYSPLESVKNPKNMLACDHLAYIGGYPMEADWLYKFNLNDPLNLTLVCSGDGPNPTDYTAGAAWTNEGKITFLRMGYGWLGTIDPETCDWYWIMGGGADCEGLAWDSVNNRLFATSGMVLFEYDPETGEQTFIGYHSQPPTDIILCDIACDGDGILYGWEWLNRRLCTIDIDTGNATVVGELNISPHYPMEGAFCIEDDILYIFAYGTDPFGLYLYECDEDTGSCTLVSQIEDPVTPELFVIPWNYRPYVPSNPIPLNGTTDVDIEVDLSWDCADPDDDSLTYDVYLDIVSPPIENVSDDQTETIFDPGTLEFGTTYYWQIIAMDEHGASSNGPIWHFTTEKNYPPDIPIIDGPDKGKSKTTYEYNFISVDPDGHDVYYWIDWGDGNVEQDDWIGPYSSGEKVNFSHSWAKKDKFTIKARSKDIYNTTGNWSEFEVTIPRSRITYYSFFYWFLERFQILQKLLYLLRGG